MPNPLFGLASSHAPAIFCPADLWPKIYAAIPEYTHQSQPHTARLETAEVIEQQIVRINAAFGVLRDELAGFKPDALIMIGDDQGDMFSDANQPSLAIFTGDEVWGSSASFYVDEPAEASRIHIPVHTELAHALVTGLIDRQFDPAASAVLKPQGRRPERGISHMLVTPAPHLMPELDIPIVPVFINEYFPPMPSARRCWDLGLAIADIVAARPERVAIYASGGLSHDPGGPRAGWIDEPLDRWVLERISRNQGEQLTRLFTFDSDTLRGGTGEIRAWITVAGACRRPARVVEYFPSHHAKTGLGWACWPLEDH